MAPRASRRGRRASRRRLRPLVLALALLALGAVALERAGRLPEPAAGVVREAESAVLGPLLREMGIGWPVAAPPVPLSSPDDRAAVAQALRLLKGVPGEPERRAGYDRGDWPHWTDADGNCLDARHEVLASESLEGVRLSRDGCSAVAGLWRVPFTGEAVTDPRALDVDRLVPLRGRRTTAAGTPGTARGGRPSPTTRAIPARWRRCCARPTERRAHKGPRTGCRRAPPTAAAWGSIKARWDLSMDERERVAVGNLLSACARG